MIADNLAVKFDELCEMPAFRNMSDEQIHILSSIMVRREYDPGQLIFMEGDQANSLWFVSEGRVKIIKQSLNGRIQGLCMMNPGKCFGSCPLFDMETNPATAQALDPVTLFILPEDAIQHLKTHNAQLVKVLLYIYSERLQHLARISEVLGSWTVADRINDCILTYANRTTDQPFVGLTHEKLACPFWNCV